MALSSKPLALPLIASFMDNIMLCTVNVARFEGDLFMRAYILTPLLA